MTTACTCYHCHSEFPYGAHVCRGCQGDVIYGHTQSEMSSGTKVGGALMLFGAFIALMTLPAQFGLPAYFGMGLKGVLVALGAAGLAGLIIGARMVRNAHAGKIRVFRTRVRY